MYCLLRSGERIECPYFDQVLFVAPAQFLMFMHWCSYSKGIIVCFSINGSICSYYGFMSFVLLLRSGNNGDSSGIKVYVSVLCES
jgi:hypothetical protein